VSTLQNAHARGTAPIATALIRQQPEDFQVQEQCPVAFADTGEHLWLYIEKSALTTQQVVAWLAAAADVARRDIGLSGLKDRHAVTRQWFSMPWPMRREQMFRPAPQALDPLPADSRLQILQQRRHTRKLRRGTHAANAFDLTLRRVTGPPDAIETDLQRIRRHGVPNYFGPQRFGRDGGNLELARALFAGRRLRRNKRGFALSAARSFLFNAVLDARVREQSWNRTLPGEAVMLDGSHSIFSAAEESETELQRRLQAFDIHPSGPLPGRAAAGIVDGEALALENEVLAAHQELVDGLLACRVEAARRALRLVVRDLHWHWSAPDCLHLRFTLPTGSFATAVLREVVHYASPRKNHTHA